MLAPGCPRVPNVVQIEIAHRCPYRHSCVCDELRSERVERHHRRGLTPRIIDHTKPRTSSPHLPSHSLVLLLGTMPMVRAQMSVRRLLLSFLPVLALASAALSVPL